MSKDKNPNQGNVSQAARPSFVIAGITLILGWLLMYQGSNIEDNNAAITIQVVAVMSFAVCIIASGIFIARTRNWWAVPATIYIIVSLVGAGLSYVILSLLIE